MQGVCIDKATRRGWLRLVKKCYHAVIHPTAMHRPFERRHHNV
jgi:hypothetical protein